MKKKIMLIIVLCFTLITSVVTAETFYEYFPGGKNYLYEGNFSIYNITLSSIDDVKVKSSTTYTISYPGLGMIDAPMMSIEGNHGHIYFDDDIDSDARCSITVEVTSCTFTTNNDTEYLSIAISGHGIAQYFEAYQLKDFQLEEGLTRTAYEEYIIPMIDTTSPEFEGSGAYIMSYTDNYTIEEIIDAHIVVIDEVDGDLTSSIEIISDEYTPNKNTVGEYLVELQVSDSSNNTANFNLVVVIKDEVVPVITGPDSVDVNVDDAILLDEIVSNNFSVADGHDTELSITVTYDEYTSNLSTLGAYNVTLYTIDTSGNEVTKDIVINVIDTTIPTVVSSTDLTVTLSDPKTLEDILDAMVLSDNYDDASLITKTIITDEYSNNNNTLGTHLVNMIITDSSGNNNSIDLNITVVDDVYPTITGPSSYSFSYTNPHTLEEVLNILVVNDNHTNLSLSDLVVITDTYSTRKSTIGTFAIEVQLSDNSGNTVTHSMMVTIVDDQAPIIYIDDYVVTLSGNVSFSLQDALNIMVHNQELPHMNYSATLLEDEYSGNESIPGTYSYKVKFTDEQGDIVYKDFIIEVPEEEFLDGLDVDLLIRNIVVYSLVFIIFGYVVYKNRK